jgi:phosphoribosylformimino-5-aminoimidazole carboxamide ribotide isomerase
MIVYPAIDLAGGKCVRLKQGRFEDVTVYGDDPLAMADAFARAGATVLHVVDLDGARDPRARQLTLLERLSRHTRLAMQVGGGIRSVADVRALLAVGVSRVVLGSLAVREPEAALEMLAAFGPSRIVFGLDVRLDEVGEPRLLSHGWRTTESHSLWTALERFVPAGLKTLLCTDVARDGMLAGPSVELYRELRRRHLGLELLASGGIASLDDLRALSTLGAAGAVVGKALYEKRFTLEEALRC